MNNNIIVLTGVISQDDSHMIDFLYSIRNSDIIRYDKDGGVNGSWRSSREVC